MPHSTVSCSRPAYDAHDRPRCSLLKVDMRGRGGVALKDKWNEGPKTYLGLTVVGFPNLFMITGPGSPSVLTNMLPSIEQHVDFIADCLEAMRAKGVTVIEPVESAQEEWVGHVGSVADITLRSTCSSWYVGANIPGKAALSSCRMSAACRRCCLQRRCEGGGRQATTQAFPGVFLNTGDAAGLFIFHDPAAGTRGSMRVFYARPTSIGHDTRVVFAMHGFDRAAAGFRDCWLDHAHRLGLLVLVPEFDAEAFPGAHGYNFGNARSPDPDGAMVPRKLWNFGILDRVFEQARASLDLGCKTFSLFGNSAGGQYVLRYMALTAGSSVDVAISSNCGIYMLPDLAVDYPNGMGGLDLDESFLRRYLARQVVILLSEADTDSLAPDLPRGEAALAQGPHRLARGLWHFDRCRTLAAHLGVDFGWRLERLPGAHHVDPKIFDRAAEIVAASPIENRGTR